MSKQQQIQLLLNDELNNHRQSLSRVLEGAKKLECMVAFAKTSGLELILSELKKSLSAGLIARFAIGLDFCITEPNLLRQLLELSSKHSLALYLSKSAVTFHPKIYALSDGNDCTVLIGSANMTGGGLQGNYEASARIDDSSGTLMLSISSHIEDLIAQKVLIPATKARIDEYERLYNINQAQQRLAKRRTKLASTDTGINTVTLRDILLAMKDDSSENGFVSHQKKRRINRNAAARKIVTLASMRKVDADAFLEHYEQLLLLFHSGGLHRGKNIIADNAGKFHAALSAIVKSKKLTPGDAYQLMVDHFQYIPRAGVNVLTEILHALDCKRFVVMNQNSVSGLRLANIHDFPSKPTKKNVSADSYAHYCQQANMVRKELRLANFSELDALFNYAYWEQDEKE